MIFYAGICYASVQAVRLLLNVASALDAERLDLPHRSAERYALLVLAAVVEAVGAGLLAVALYCLIGFIHAAWRSFQ